MPAMKTLTFGVGGAALAGAIGFVYAQATTAGPSLESLLAAVMSWPASPQPADPATASAPAGTVPPNPPQEAGRSTGAR